MTRYLIFDTGPLINLVSNSLTKTLENLSEIFPGEFLITPEVKYEGIEHPLNIKKFEWGALRIKKLIDDEIIIPAENYAISKKELAEMTEKVMSDANNALRSEGSPIHLIEKGEAECLALSILLTEKGIENAAIIDERTARMLCEDPIKLKELMQEKLEKKLELNKQKLEKFKRIKILRSTEMMYLAYKKGALDISGKKVLEAILYALKFNGCSISEKEIETMKNL